MEKIVSKKKKFNRLDFIFIVSMLTVPVIHWLVFWLGVNFNSILLAFQKPGSNALTLETMKEAIRVIFTNGSDMQIALRNTLIYFTKDLLLLPFQLLIAYFFYRKIKGTKFFRIMFYLPSIISGVAISSMYSQFINGPLTELLAKLGVENVPEFFLSSNWANKTLIFYTIWLGWGGHMLLLGGALARIPVEVVESARIDGISSPREFVSIILPLIWPSLSTIIILQMTTLFTASGPMLLFRDIALNEDVTWTIAYWIFYKVWKNPSSYGLYNTIAAYGVFFTLVGIPIVLGLKALIEKIPTVEY